MFVPVSLSLPTHSKFHRNKKYHAILSKDKAEAASLVETLHEGRAVWSVLSTKLNNDQLVRLAVLLAHKKVQEEEDQKEEDTQEKALLEMESAYRQNDAVLCRSLRDNLEGSSLPERNYLELTLFQVMAAHRFMVAAKLGRVKQNLDALVDDIGPSVILGRLEKAYSYLPDVSSKVFLFLEANALTKRNESQPFMEIALALGNKERLIFCGLAALLSTTT